MSSSSDTAKQDRFIALYEPCYPRLYRYVHSVVWNREDAKDLLSEVVLAAFEGLDRLKREEEFVFYLFGIASRLIQKSRRRDKFKAVFDEKAMEERPASQHAERSFLNVELSRLLSSLTLEQRQSIILYEISGFSYEEIAKLENCSLQAVKNRIMRGRQVLQQKVHEEQQRVLKATGGKS